MFGDVEDITIIKTTESNKASQRFQDVNVVKQARQGTPHLRE